MSLTVLLMQADYPVLQQKYANSGANATAATIGRVKRSPLRVKPIHAPPWGFIQMTQKVGKSE